MSDQTHNRREDVDNFRDDPDHDLQQIVETAAAPVVGSSPDAIERRRLGRLIAVRRLLLRSLPIPYGPQQELATALDEALYSADALREAGLPQPSVLLLADSFSGKSSGALRYVRQVFEREEHRPGTTPVAYVKLDADGTVGSLATDILTALHMRRPNALTPDKRWERAREAIRERGVSLLIFDEFQRAGRRPTISPIIAQKILDILDGDDTRGGDCACAFLGKETAVNVFKSLPDLRNRLDAPVQIPRLIWARDGKEFMAFADAYDQALVDADIIAYKAGLGTPVIAQLLLESSGGLIGRFARIIETAVLAITREGVNTITRADLQDAVSDWAIGNGHIGHNPFEKSKDSSAKAAKAGKNAKEAVNHGAGDADPDQERGDTCRMEDSPEDDDEHSFAEGQAA
ncbi:TniB family NTP-binding protein [Sphingomonas yabuuchiae]|uniref:TniB family NTP-binding protein n=1 Tax=Sphingomonas yabuuchiae TaxID=172044 RepID=UPI0025D11EB9|nr:TniB family NTP-binding protein [uncultured Sphingomonas sp.]